MRRTAFLIIVCLMAAACGSAPTGEAQLDGTRPLGVDATPASVPPTTNGSSGSTASSSPTTVRPGATTSAPDTGGLRWQNCGLKLQCATLTVPRAYDDPSKGTLDLFLKRRPADRRTGRIGTLLVNPGGPGVAGTLLVDAATDAFGPALLERFDILGWDPRGTGKSGQIVCVDNFDPYFAIDQSPDDDTERKALDDAAKQFADQCHQHAGDLLPYVSTEASARDMNEIRKALGEQKISFFGFSYGSELGAVWATLFPDTVRAAVLDGASDVNATADEDLRQQTIGLERALNNLLDDCAKDRTCPIYNGGNPGAVFDRVMASLDRSPLSVPNAPGRPKVNDGVASWAVTSVLYEKETWPALTSALAEAERGNGRPLLDLYDAYLTGYGLHAFDALLAIRCIDDPEPDDQAHLAALDKELRSIAPRLGPYALGPPICNYWPVKGKAEPKVTAKGAGPIVVVGTTGDPVTPIEASANLAKSLEQGTLVTVQAEKHTGYQTSACIDDAVENYLTDLRVPKTGLVCKGTN